MNRSAPPHGRLLGLAVPVAAAGAVGSLARYGLDRALPAGPGGLPVATLAVNVTGALLLGVLVGRRGGPSWWRPVLGTGLLGGFTTFSAFAVQVDRLPAGPAAAYVGLTLLLGLPAARAGLALGGRPGPAGRVPP